MAGAIPVSKDKKRERERERERERKRERRSLLNVIEKLLFNPTPQKKDQSTCIK